MIFARILWPLAIAAALAACSGNIGGGQSTLPGGPGTTSSVDQNAAPTPTPTPNSASNVATIGDNAAAQVLPAVQGWSGAITFAKPVPAPSPSPNPKATAAPAPEAAGPVSIGITTAVVEPSDAPHFAGERNANPKRVNPSVPAALLYITLLATSDVTLPSYPAIAIDMPREIAAKYHDRPFGLALYDPDTKTKAYRLAVAERDTASPAPGSLPTATPTPLPTVTPTPAATGAPNAAVALTPPPIGSAVGSSGLPPEHIAFLPAATVLTLHANRSVVFALYAAPAPSASPTPKAAPSGPLSAAPSPAAPAATASASSAPTAAPVTAPTTSL